MKILTSALSNTVSSTFADTIEGLLSEFYFVNKEVVKRGCESHLVLLAVPLLSLVVGRNRSLFQRLPGFRDIEQMQYGGRRNMKFMRHAVDERFAVA